MSTFHHDGIDLHYERHGSPDGLPVVLLHGLSSCGATYVELLAALGDRVDAYTLDFRGHGQSARASGTYVGAKYSADVRAFLAQVVGRPVFLAGHSLGGVHTFSVAQSSPELVRGAFCEDPPLYFAIKTTSKRAPTRRSSRKSVTPCGRSRPPIRPVNRYVPISPRSRHRAVASRPTIRLMRRWRLVSMPSLAATPTCGIVPSQVARSTGTTPTGP
ncbi:MAG: alpha/beta hydrolase [Acidimicrobiaceae bacterium]|nr:alpha/beta hydrolase [Acidimicrobiaceae bacterium]